MRSTNTKNQLNNMIALRIIFKRIKLKRKLKYKYEELVKMKEMSIIALVIILLINVGNTLIVKVYAENYKKKYEKLQSTKETADLIKKFEEEAQAGSKEFELALPILKAGEEAKKNLVPFIFGVFLSVICSLLNLVPIGLINFVKVSIRSEDEKAIQFFSIIFLLIHAVLIISTLSDAISYINYLDSITIAINN